MNYLSAIIDNAEQAGQAILAVYQQDNAAFNITGKADDSPLTAADLAAHQLIVKALTALTPELPILSEEAADISWDIRQRWQRYWLVDPLDGTKEFIKRNGEFTVNIALIEHHQPVLGVIHIPVANETYMAMRGNGAIKIKDDRTHQLLKQQNEIRQPLIFAVSRSHLDQQTKDFDANLNYGCGIYTFNIITN